MPKDILSMLFLSQKDPVLGSLKSIYKELMDYINSIRNAKGRTLDIPEVQKLEAKLKQILSKIEGIQNDKNLDITKGVVELIALLHELALSDWRELQKENQELFDEMQREDLEETQKQTQELIDHLKKIAAKRERSLSDAMIVGKLLESLRKALQNVQEQIHKLEGAVKYLEKYIQEANCYR